MMLQKKILETLKSYSTEYLNSNQVESKIEPDAGSNNRESTDTHSGDSGNTYGSRESNADAVPKKNEKKSAESQEVQKGGEEQRHSRAGKMFLKKLALAAEQGTERSAERSDSENKNLENKNMENRELRNKGLKDKIGEVQQNPDLNIGEEQSQKGREKSVNGASKEMPMLLKEVLPGEAAGGNDSHKEESRESLGRMLLHELVATADSLYFSKKYSEAIRAYETALNSISNPNVYTSNACTSGEKSPDNAANFNKYNVNKYDIIKRIALSYAFSRSPELAINKIESCEEELKNSTSNDSKWMLREFTLIKGFALGMQKKSREDALEMLASLTKNKEYVDLDAMLEHLHINSKQKGYEALCRQADELISLMQSPKKNIFYTATLDSAERILEYFMREADYTRVVGICDLLSSLNGKTDEKILKIRMKALEKSGTEDEIKSAAEDFVRRFYTSEYAMRLAKKYDVDA